MIKRNFKITLLLIYLFLVIIKSISTFNQESIELIVDSNSKNPDKNKCGSSLVNACISLENAFNYYISSIQPGNTNNSLVLKLVDGTYPIIGNSFFRSINFTILPYTFGSNNIIIDGNINGNLDLTFNNCKFSNSEIWFDLTDLEKMQASLKFIDSIFENLLFRTPFFSIRNFKIELISSQMKSVYFPGGLSHVPLSIKSCFFNNITSGDDLFQYSEYLSIQHSTFNDIYKKYDFISFLIYAFNTSKTIEINNNTFTNFQGSVLKGRNGTIIFNSNTISNIQIDLPIIDVYNSNLTLNSNTFNLNNIVVYETLVCHSSSVTFINNNGGDFDKKGLCLLCGLTYNGKELCDRNSSAVTTTNHLNGSLNSKLISFQLLYIVLILISLL
ncbi:hypothetical protein ACTA71_011253 [Dictyostelium dimigraforme]